MIYHVAKQSGFSYPDPNFFRKATDFGAALYCSFDEDLLYSFTIIWKIKVKNLYC